MPALAITTSMPPNRSMPAAAAACMADRSRTSATTVSTRSPPRLDADLGEQGFVEVGQHQLGALGVQATGHLGADAVRAAGDEHDFSVHGSHVRNVLLQRATPNSSVDGGRDGTLARRCRVRRTRARRCSNHPARQWLSACRGRRPGTGAPARSRRPHRGRQAGPSQRASAPAGPAPRRERRRSSTGRSGSARPAVRAGWRRVRRHRPAAGTPAPGCRGSCSSCGRPSRSCPTCT